jgi:hypothetical protein
VPGRCGDAIERATPYHAWRPIFADLMGSVGIDVEERRRRVLARLQADPEMARLAPLLNSVLPLDLPDNEPTAQLTGEVRADNTRQLLVQLLQPTSATRAGRAAPLLIVLDDARWFDSASWALTRLVVARVRPLLLVLATRPLVEPLPDDYRRLRQDPATEYLRLEPLSPHDTLALVCDRLGVRHLPEPVAALIQERAQGNPFFSEELAYALRDAGLIRITDGTCTIAPGAGAPSAMSFPDTMQGVVAARTDRLPPGQELTLKVASVVGRLFAFRLLRDIHPIEADRTVLRGFLDDLQRHDFTVLDTPEPDLAYLFKHVVTQEVAYGLLLSAQRRQLHRAVAEWYEQTQAEDLPALYPLLAYHWGRAEEPTKTLAYLALAGEQALRVGAYQEAVDLLTDALSRSGAVQPAPDALRQARWHRQLAVAYEGLGRLSDWARPRSLEVARSGPYHPEQLPGTLDAPQPLRAAVVQDDIGAHDQVPHGLGGEDLTGPGRCHHPRRDVHGDAADVTVTQLDLAGMQPHPNLDADAAQLVPEGGRAADPAARPVEGGQQPITGRLHKPAAELLDQPAGQLVVHVQQLPPAPVPQPAGAFGGGDDVGEQHRGQHPIGLGSPTGTGQELLDQIQGELGLSPRPASRRPRAARPASPRECARRDIALSDREELNVSSVHDEGWRLGHWWRHWRRGQWRRRAAVYRPQ